MVGKGEIIFNRKQQEDVERIEQIFNKHDHEKVGFLEERASVLFWDDIFAHLELGQSGSNGQDHHQDLIAKGIREIDLKIALVEISKLKRLKSTKTSPRIIQEADELLKKIDIQITEKREALNFYKDNAREIS